MSGRGELEPPNGIVDLYYPESNCLVADVALKAGRPGWSGFDKKLLKNIKDSLRAKKGHDANFWSVVGTIEVRQYEALATKRLRLERGSLERAYEDLHKR